jgi:hypothetical protein
MYSRSYLIQFDPLLSFDRLAQIDALAHGMAGVQRPRPLSMQGRRSDRSAVCELSHECGTGHSQHAAETTQGPETPHVLQDHGSSVLRVAAALGSPE